MRPENGVEGVGTGGVALQQIRNHGALSMWCQGRGGPEELSHSLIAQGSTILVRVTVSGTEAY